MISNGILRQASEGGIILVVPTTHFVNYDVQRGHDHDAETTRTRFIECIPRRADDVLIGILLEHQRVRGMRVERRGFVAERHVIGWDKLLLFPFPVMEQTISK